MKPLLEVDSVTKDYGKLRALDDLSLSVYPGEIFALLGPNGAGKTTLIGCITGLIRSFQGQISVAGHDVVKDYRLTRQLVGVVHQELNFDAFFNTFSLINFQGGFFSRRDSIARANELLEAFSLKDKATSNSRWLSGGMKRRLMICKALMHDPPLLFLDEPTAGVDVDLRDELWDYVRELRNRGTTIVLTTHYLEEAEQLADRIGIIHQGQLKVVERRDDLLNQYGERWVRVRFRSSITKAVFGSIDHCRIDQEDEKTLHFAFADNAGRHGNTAPPVDEILAKATALKIGIDRVEGGRSRLEEIFKGIIGNSVTGGFVKNAHTLPDISEEIVRVAEAKVAARIENVKSVKGWLGTFVLFKKELQRFMAIAGQTIVSPILTTMLWYLVFGYSLGTQLQEIRGIPYTDFLVPGLVMMAIITNAFLNSGFSFFITKVHGSVVDLYVTPLTPFQIMLAYIGASVIRAMLVGSIIWIVAALMGAGTFYNVGWTFLYMLLTSTAFAIAGLITGILAKDFDHVNFIPSFLLMPLTFLGGVFYSIQMLPKPWDLVSHFNPIVYMVNGLRYGMTGVTDVPVISGLVIVALSVLVGGMVVVSLLHHRRES